MCEWLSFFRFFFIFCVLDCLLACIIRLQTYRELLTPQNSFVDQARHFYREITHKILYCILHLTKCSSEAKIRENQAYYWTGRGWGSVSGVTGKYNKGWRRKGREDTRRKNNASRTVREWRKLASLAITVWLEMTGNDSKVCIHTKLKDGKIEKLDVSISI